MPGPPTALLLIIRHAAAEDTAEGGTDLERALTGKGQRQAADLGRFLRHHGILPQAILTSPAVRARQTAEIVAQNLGAGVQVLHEEMLLPGARPETILAHLGRWQGSWPVALVGHEPDLGALAGVLAGGPGSHPMPLKKSGLALFELERCAAGGGRLLWFLPPKLVRRFQA
jgi:phosphohistidine phosphatase